MMTSDDLLAGLALALFTTGVVITFGVRTWAHRRRTGSSGFNGITGAPGSAEWWGGILFIAALALAGAGLVLAVTGMTPVIAGIPVTARWLGAVATLAGFSLVLAAQTGMGASWRIGVDDSERTALVTTGLFAHVRNPIFTAMCLAQGGLALMAPTALTLVAVAFLVAAVELQVRVVEEPYLLATHGTTYAQYAARVGRFLPRLGRLSGSGRLNDSREVPT